MASINNDITISRETRLCEVHFDFKDHRLGLFHMWEHYSQPIEASPLVGGAPAGVISRVYGIVEFPDGVKRVDPTQIKFCDDKNAYISEMSEKWDKVMKGENDD